MVTVVNKIDKNSVEVKVTFEQKDWAVAQNKAVEKLAANLEVKGFRKGKAPLDVARKSLDNQKVFEEALNTMIPQGYRMLQEEHALEVVVQPDVSVLVMSETELTLSYALTLRPEIKLGQYEGIRIEKEPVVVTDEDIAAAIEEIRQNAAIYLEKEDDTIENGDIVTFDFEGFVDGVAFDGGKAENYELLIGSNQFIPGFEEQMVGLKRGEEKDINVVFPENYAPELAGKEATFKLKIHSLKLHQLPEVNDELALDANMEGVSTLAELKFHLGNQIEERKSKETHNAAVNKLMKTIVENAEVEIPSRLLETEAEHRFEHFKVDVQKRGLSYEQYLEFTAQSEEAVKEHITKETEIMLKSTFVLSEIAKINEVKVEDADIDAIINELADTHNLEAAKVKEALAERMDEVANQAYGEKVNKFILSKNIIE